MKSNAAIAKVESPGKTQKFVTRSRANSWTNLNWDVRDLVVDRWHHPLIVQQTLESGTCLTRLQLLLDPCLLNPRLDHQSRRSVFELCQWLRSNGVRFDVGFAPLLREAGRKNRATSANAHQIILEIE